MAKLKKFSGTSSNGNVDFAVDNQVMLLNNEKTEQLSLSVIVTDGTNTATYRVQNNVSADKEPEELFKAWVRTNCTNPDITEEQIESGDFELKGIVFANHNIVGLGRPIIVPTGVQLQFDHSGKIWPVSRYAAYYPNEDVKAQIVADLKLANLTIREEQKEILEDMAGMREGSSIYNKAEENYNAKGADKALNSMKISCLQTPYVAGMSTAFISTDEAQVREAFKNANFDFEKIFIDGFDFETADTTEQKEDDLNVAGATAETEKPIAEQMNEEVGA